MNQMQLYIKDQLVDLSDDSPIALTFQINDLAEVKNQQGNTSNQFKLPLTQNNRRILGYPDDIAFCTAEPYRQYPARLIQDGIEVVPFGFAELNSIEQNIANVTILSGNVDFFDAIDGKIYDMGDITTTYGLHTSFGPYDHNWTLDNIINSQQKTEGWIWPVVDYGKISTDAVGQATIDVRYLRPGFFLHTAIDVIVNNAGYRAKGSLLGDELYQKLIVQFANDSFEHSTDIQNAPDPYSISVQNNTDQFCSYSTSNKNHDGTVKFQNITLNPSGAFKTDNSFIAPEDMNATVEFNYSLKVRGTKKNHSAGIQMFVQSLDPITGSLTHLTENTHWADQPVNVWAEYKKQKLSADATFVKGQAIIIAFHFDFDGSEAYILEGSIFTVTNKQKDVLYKQTIQCDRIFPDIGQKDLLKDTLQHFGIICQTDNTNKTVNFAFFKEIVHNIPIAKDWTKKCLDQGKTVSFQLGGYAQVNNLKYKDDDNVLPAGQANSVIKVDDTTLAATADLFESQFAPTLNRAWIGGTISQILKVDTSGDTNATDFSISTQPRLLINDTIKVQNVTFTDGITQKVLNNDLVSVPYFDKTGADDSLKYENLRLKYYPELERILKNIKRVVRYFILTPRDISELDLLVPVYLQQDSAYYYINKIDSWQKGKATKVELVKLG